MKELNFLKRLSAITLAAAITAANVGFDFLPTAKKAAAEPKEENTVTEVKTPKVMTQKSKYPTSLSFIVEKNEDGESVLRASNPTVFNRYFTAELISLDPPAEGEEAEQLVFSAEGTVIRKGGNYTVNVKARINEETGELVYNPYKMISGGITIAEEASVPEVEKINQEIAVIEDGEIVEEAAEVPQEVISEEIISEEPAEIPGITETSVNIRESDVNAANGMFDMSQSQKLDYTVVKSQDSYNVMIPDDYDELFLNGIDEEGNAFFNAAGEEVQVNFNEIEMNIQVVNFAELKIKDIAEPEDYSIERFCGEETLPYYYGEIVKVTPSSGYNIVVGDMKFSDAVSVAINDDAVTTEEVAINVYEGENISQNFEVIKDDTHNKATVQPKAGVLNGMKYTLSVECTDYKREETGKSLNFPLDKAKPDDDGNVRVEASGIEGAKCNGSLEKLDEINCSYPDKPLIDYVNGNMTDATWYENGKLTAARLSFKDGAVKINKVSIKSTTGKPYATYDANGKLTGGDSSIISDDANVTKGSWEFFMNPAGVNNLHEDLYIDVDYDVYQTIKISFTAIPDPKNSNITAFLNNYNFNELDKNYDFEKDEKKILISDNKVTFKPSNGWIIEKIEYDGKTINDNNSIQSEFSIGTAEDVKKHGDYVFKVTLMKKQIEVTIDCGENRSSEISNVSVQFGTDSRLSFIDKETTKKGNAGNITLLVTPKMGYYVYSIKRGEEELYNIENDKYKECFNDKNCQITIGETINQNVTYKIVCKAAELNKDIKAKITKIDDEEDNLDDKYTFNEEANKFLIISDAQNYTLAFNGKNFFNPKYSTYNGRAEDGIVAEYTIDTYIEEMSFYFVNGGTVEKAVVTVKSAEANPEITGFTVEKGGTTAEQILNVLTFGIFSNDTINLTVRAKDESGLYAISDIELKNGETLLDGNFDKLTASKTFTLTKDKLDKTKQYNLQYNNLKARAISKAKVILNSNKKDEIEKAKPHESLVDYKINVKGNHLNASSVDVDAVNSNDFIPVVIENGKPTLNYESVKSIYKDDNNANQLKDVFSKSTDSLWVKDTAQFTFKAKDSESGIDAIKYRADNSEDWKTIDYSSDWNKEIPVNITLTTNDDVYENSLKVKSDEYKHTLDVIAIDHAGNESEVSSVPINIDGKAPEITLNTENFDKWRNNDITYYFTVTDDGAGIAGIESVTAKKTGTDINIPVEYAEDDTDHTKYKFTVQPDFQGTVTITAIDFVGNPSEATTAELKTEITKPRITGFSIASKNGDNNELKDRTDSYDRNFKYYFDEDVIVTIYASDGIVPDLFSDIKNIYLGTVNSDGNGNYDINQINQLELKPIQQNEYGNWFVDYEINAGFEGLLLFRTEDNAGNIMDDWITPEMLIAEDPDSHAYHSSAEIILPETPYSNGNPLYDNAPEITLNLRDSASGIDISKIECTINEDPVSNIEWNYTYKRNIVTNATATIKCSDLDKNGITINLKAEDNAGNEITEVSQTISIDKSEPDISVTFNPVGSANQEFFNKQRTATVLAKDRNLRLDNLRELIDVTVTNALGTSAEPCKITQDWKMVENIKEVAGKPVEVGEEVYKCEITFVQDAEYSFAISAEDLTNKTKKSETFKFIIDTTAPKLSITFDNNSKANDKYYNAGRKATLTINEHNFAKNKDSVKSVLSAKDADGLTAMDSKEIYDGKLTWTQSKTNKDEWTAQVNFNKEGTFDFSMAYTDPAGNSGNNADSGEFVIDTTAPKIEQSFTRSGNKLATNSDLVPHVIFSDYNFLSENQIGNNCKVTIRKFGENGLSSENFSATSRSYTSKNADSPVTFEQIFDIFDKEIEVDGIYEIAIRAEDLAGNVTEINDLTVSINRFGPTYMILNEEARKAVEKYAANEIPIKDNIGLEIAEVNVTPLSGKGIVRVSVDGTSINELEDGFETSENRVSLADDVWEENENGWYQTVYKIDKKNFEKDGKYRVTLESEDEAGNKYLSDSATSPRTNFAASFAVDTTEPTIIIAGADEEEYKETELELTVKLSDINSYSIDELDFDPDNKDNSTFYVKINDEYHDIDSLKKQCEGEISKDASGDIVIKMMVKASEKNQKQNIDVFIKDKAGNQTIGTESFVLGNTNNWFMIIIIAAGVIILCTAVFFVTKKVRKR